MQKKMQNSYSELSERLAAGVRRWRLPPGVDADEIVADALLQAEAAGKEIREPFHWLMATASRKKLKNFYVAELPLHDSVLNDLADRPAARDGVQMRLDRSPAWHSMPQAKKHAIT